MACITLYDVKRVGYQVKASGDVNYMAGISTTPAVTLKELLAQSDIVIDTKGELATYKILNSTKYGDERNNVIRKKGSIKFTRNIDANLFGTHSELVNAALGAFLSTGTASGESILEGGTGAASGSKFIVKSGSDSPVVGQLIHIPNYGLRVVTDVSGGITVDRPIDTPISGATAISILDTYSLHNPKGTCDNSFNVVVENHQGSNSKKEYIVAMGCNCTMDFSLNFDKQLTVGITFTSPDMYLTDSDSLIPTYTSESIAEPWICNFDEAIYIASDNHETPYYPQSIDLGRSNTEEPLIYPGGRNNIRGYLNRVSFKPIIKLDIDTTGKLIRTACMAGNIFGYSLKQSQFGIYMSHCQGGQVDHTTNNSNHDAAIINLDANHLSDSKIMLGLF